jgi:pilus assembly protein CpaB
MISLRNAAMLTGAVVLAGGTALYVNAWLQAERASIAANQTTEVQIVEAETAHVLVAAQDLPAGSFLSADKLEWRAWPEDGVHDNYIVRDDDAEENDTAMPPEKELEGAVVRVNVRASEPITTVRVVHPGEQGFLAAVLEPGFRAVSVPVDATSGISGFVFPGDWVDVVLTMQMRDAREEARQQRYFAQTVLEKVRILAIDQAVEMEDGAALVAKTTTLEVTPKEAEHIAVALEMGRLSLSLNSLSQNEGDSAYQDRLIGGDGDSATKVRSASKSYTLDTDVYHMLGDHRLFPQQRAQSKVNIVRGSDSDVHNF